MTDRFHCRFQRLQVSESKSRAWCNLSEILRGAGVLFIKSIDSVTSRREENGSTLGTNALLVTISRILRSRGTMLASTSAADVVVDL